MAAQDTFENVIHSLTTEERSHLSEYLRAKREELFAARSEDARVRLVGDFLNEVHNLRERTKQSR